MRLLLVGPPGAGKGTQSRKLAERLGVPHIASGELLRDAIARGTDIGLKAAAYMDRGDLVPDEVMIWFIATKLDALKAQGFVLDGFPRTVNQAEALDKALAEQGLPLDLVIHLFTADEELIRRMTGRRTCPACHRAYHMVYNQPKEDERCDDDQTALVTRADDSYETVRHRLDVYRRDTEDLIRYYSESGLLVTLDGLGEPSEVSDRIDAELEKAK